MNISSFSRKLQDEEVKELFSGSDWKIDEGKLKRDFSFGNYSEQIEFVYQVGLVACALNHHPDIFVYQKKTCIEISTHQVQGLTLLDFVFTKQVNGILRRYHEHSK